MAICANSPWLADLVSELYADLHSLDPSIVGIDLVFFIINKVPKAADDASMMLVIVVMVQYGTAVAEGDGGNEGRDGQKKFS